MGSWFQSFWEKRLAKKQSAAATIISRSLQCSPTAVFRLTSGQELELNLTQPQFDSLADHQTGILHWKGDVFLSFDPA